MNAQILITASCIAVVVVYAGLSAFLTSRAPGWYDRLPRPAWQPPDWMFGVMWPLNFLALGLASYAIGVYSPPEQSLAFLNVLLSSTAFALLWAFFFYVPPHRLLVAAIALTVATVLAWGLVFVAWQIISLAGAILVPYALWLTVATSLAYGYHRLVDDPMSV
ncbi:TspO/MBR family protein [Ornithinimicrobium sediminis]|uniref:TspO/MBR family protein n=1 Tax=Ornithinimicrobium sediminis TaxID=2904603 RepID=UPI001E49CA68|nr:TspO/MBR family protein [Ornithinimicrobium sediminis]MCE0486934.1 tryptophan-rich sensory protein [Ornithinimicrobium sediminis]